MKRVTLDRPPAIEWTPEEAREFKPTGSLTCSQWAERHRYLDDRQSEITGPWRNANAAYLRGIMDLGFLPGVREITIVKAAQVGVSEAMRNVLAYVAHHDPSPSGLLLPDKLKGEQIVNDRILPMFRVTTVLQSLMTERAHDAKKSQLTLANSFTLYLMWSGSASSLASNPLRFAIADETDKFVPFSGREADPVSLLRKRQTTFIGMGRARLWKVSTPTTDLGVIWREHQAADVQLYFLVPCPKCDSKQRLIFEQVKWEIPAEITDPVEKAKYVEAHGAEGVVWYECRSCGHRLDEAAKRVAVAAGKWGTCNPDGLANGEVEDAESLPGFRRGTRLSMHISALYCKWITLADIAGEFLRTQSSPSVGPLFDFTTGTLGEAFEQRITRIENNSFSDLSEAAQHDEGVVPPWAASLIAAIDTQQDHFWCVVRAWGPQMRSQRIWHGRLESFEELDQICTTPFRVAGDMFPPMTVCAGGIAAIDSGGTTERGARLSRTQEVYRWAMDRTSWVLVVKGTRRQVEGQGWKQGRGYYDLGGGADKIEVRLWLLDVNRGQDELVDWVRRSRDADPDKAIWMLNRRNDPVYNQHLSNMHKIAVREGNTMKERWVPIRAGAHIDLRDCEVYQIFAAYLHRVHLLPDVASFIEHKKQAIAAAQRPRRKARPFTMPDGRPYLVTERGGW
ncbi:MAG: phage terminase large subunit family protein [Phycisphaerales bacterium]|nr:phage terminase large subunit family protein [Phycisphaerales bacterium]